MHLHNTQEAAIKAAQEAANIERRPFYVYLLGRRFWAATATEPIRTYGSDAVKINPHPFAGAYPQPHRNSA